jgi:Family of unknown function (DUF5985)
MSETMRMFNHVVSGAITMGYAVVGLFFLRFWRETRDRLFLIFAIAFWILSAQRVALVFSRHMAETGTGLYLARLFAFLLILAAIIDKNRAQGS